MCESTSPNSESNFCIRVVGGNLNVAVEKRNSLTCTFERNKKQSFEFA